MWSYIKAPFVWVADKWNKFEVWLAGKMPGLKVKLVAASGALVSAALAVQGYITGLPADKLLTPTKLLIANVFLFSIIYWFRRLTTIKSSD